MPTRPRHPGRPARALVVAAATVLVATGCSGSDEPDTALGSDTPSAAPTASDPAESPTPTADPAADQRGLKALVNRYDRALAKVARSRAADGSLDGAATPDFAAMVLGNYRRDIFGEGMVVVGDVIVRFESASVEGDDAEIQVCADGSGVVVVPEGETVAEGTTGQLPTEQTFVAVRDTSAPTGWLLDSVTNGSNEC